MKKILITGANGFIGRNLSEGLETEYQIHIPGHKELNLLLQEEVAEYLKKERFDVVIHSANTNPVMHPELGQFEQLDYNLKMFFNLFECRQYYGKMYYFGSGNEYDDRHYKPLMKEEYFGTHIPINSYGLSKYIMSHIAMGSSNIYDLRLFGVYGRYEEWKRRFISNIVCQVLKGQSIRMNQDMNFDYLYVDDLVRIMKWFIEHEPQHKCYNVCSGQPRSLSSLAQIVEKETGCTKGIHINKQGYKPEYSGDNQRLLEEIGNFEFTEPECGIRNLIKYYKSFIDEIEL